MVACMIVEIYRSLLVYSRSIKRAQAYYNVVISM